MSSASKPGIVILVAILNFFSTATFFSLALLSALAIVFGSAWGVDAYVSQQMANYASNPNFTYGLTIFFAVATAMFFALALFFLTIGLGLLGGKKFAWYLQVAMSTLGLLGLPLTLVASAFVLPLGAVLNIVILVMFFQNSVRSYFKV
jgi:hypothetical protein